MGKCPRCAKPINYTVNACINCGADLRPMSGQAWLRILTFTLVAVMVTWLTIHNRVA